MKKIVILSYPLAFDAPVRGGSRRNIGTPFGMEKLEWCRYQTVKNFWRYLYSFWRDPRTWQTDGQTNRHCMTAKTALASHRAVKIVVFTYPRLYFLFALGTPLWHSRKTLHEWKDNSVFAKSVAACTHQSSYQHFPSYSNRKCKKSPFLFPLETPLWQSRNMLHGWKGKSMLAKPIAACTYLSSIVSELVVA